MSAASARGGMMSRWEMKAWVWRCMKVEGRGLVLGVCCCCCCHCWLITVLSRSVAISWVLNQKTEHFCGCFECKFNPLAVSTCNDSSSSDDVVPFKDDVAAFQVMMWPHIKSDVAPCSSSSTDLLQRFLCWCNFLSRLLSRPTSCHWINHLSSMTLGAICQRTICSCT